MKKYHQSTPVKVHLNFEFQVRHSIYVIELGVNRTSVPTKAGPASAVAYTGLSLKFGSCHPRLEDEKNIVKARWSI